MEPLQLACGFILGAACFHFVNWHSMLPLTVKVNVYVNGGLNSRSRNVVLDL